MPSKTQTQTPEEKEKALEEEANDAFVAALNEHRKGKKSWNGAQSKALIKDLLVGEDGNPVKFDDDDDLTLTILADPTLGTQMEVLEKIAIKNGCELNKYQLVNIRRVMNAQLFRQELVSAKALPKPDKPKKTSMKALLNT